MKVCLFYIVRDGNWRRYYMTACSNMDELQDILDTHRSIVDFDVIYCEDLKQMDEAGILWLNEQGALIKDVPPYTSLNSNANESGSEGAMIMESESIRKFDHKGWYLVRSLFTYVPLAKRNNDIGLIEVVGLAFSTKLGVVHTSMEYGRSRVAMNYFNSDFEFSGKTYFIGVQSVLELENMWPNIKPIASEVVDDKWDFLNKPMSKRVRLHQISLQKQIEKNRSERGLSNLSKCQYIKGRKFMRGTSLVQIWDKRKALPCLREMNIGSDN